MSGSDPVDPQNHEPRAARKTRWLLLGSLGALAVAVVLGFAMHDRAKQTARERAEVEALRDLEQAKQHAHKAQQELQQAMDRIDRERERVEQSNPPYADERPLPKRLPERALHVGKVQREPAE